MHMRLQFERNKQMQFSRKIINIISKYQNTSMLAASATTGFYNKLIEIKKLRIICKKIKKEGMIE